MAAERDYQVGYGKPPRHSRFRQGQSGNPKGRPKGSRNMAALLEEALDEPVLVNEQGRRRRIAMREAIAKQLVNKAAGGDARSLQLLFATMRGSGAQQEPEAEVQALSAEDEKIMVQLSERFRRCAQAAEGGEEE